jgi:predicted MFS family arabinose efflux permease
MNKASQHQQQNDAVATGREKEYNMGEVPLARSTSAGIAAVAGDTGVVVTPELATSAGEANGASTPTTDHPPISMARTIGIALVTTFAMSLSGAGSMSLSIALPKIQTDLNMAESQLQWVSSAFALTNGCFLLLSGRVADVYGRKACFIAGVAWHALWCLIGGFMHSAAALVVTRALAGCGSALSIPSAIGIIASSVSGRTRASAFACFSAGGPIGGGFGLIIGGLLVAYTE